VQQLRAGDLPWHPSERASDEMAILPRLGAPSGYALAIRRSRPNRVRATKPGFRAAMVTLVAR
jgi:hypothetical protein